MPPRGTSKTSNPASASSVASTSCAPASSGVTEGQRTRRAVRSTGSVWLIRGLLLLDLQSLSRRRGLGKPGRPVAGGQSKKGSTWATMTAFSARARSMSCASSSSISWPWATRSSRVP